MRAANAACSHHRCPPGLDAADASEMGQASTIAAQLLPSCYPTATKTFGFFIFFSCSFAILEAQIENPTHSGHSAEYAVSCDGTKTIR
jgi:hypothetical protein